MSNVVSLIVVMLSSAMLIFFVLVVVKLSLVLLSLANFKFVN